ncbi:MAG TPA: hypothetical protein VGL72_30060 [Bryobacteraceae bacterium]|jgi:hypothetical protein
MDYTYPSIYLANLLFLILMGGAIYFCIRSRKDGYWGQSSEEPKYRMLQDDDDFTEIHHG